MKRKIKTRMDEDDIARSKIATDPRQYIKEKVEEFLFTDDFKDQIREAMKDFMLGPINQAKQYQKPKKGKK